MATITVEDYFDFLENDAGELMLVLEGREPDPENPLLLFDGKATAMLLRDAEEKIKLTEIPPAVLTILHKIKSLMVSEVDEDGDFLHVYDVNIDIVDGLPVE